jgi:hypothetical protein
LHVADDISVSNGAAISSDGNVGSAGAIEIHAGSLAIGGPGLFSTISTRTSAEGAAGPIDLDLADRLTVREGGQITSDTSGTGPAGAIRIQANAASIDGGRSFGGIFSQTLQRDGGNAGTISLNLRGGLSITNAGQISSNTFGGGNAGRIDVTARSLLISGSPSETGILSEAGSGSTGAAGAVTLAVLGDLTMTSNARIATDTAGSGVAGDVKVKAVGRILVDGSEISSKATNESAGQTGNLTVAAGQAIALSNGGSLSIRNDATAADAAALTRTLLSVSAPTIRLDHGGEITAQSTGNVAASDVDVRFTDRLVLDPSSITTSANQGDGGDIRIAGGKLLWLDHSEIITSVSGVSGNGGNISIQADTLVMNTGFIQANTAAAGASAGNVRVDVQQIVPSGGTVLVGGSAVTEFKEGVNIIQAAAPTGINGVIDVTAPVLDIAGELKPAEAKIVNLAAVGRDLCRVGAGSSLTPTGRGGLRPHAAGFIRPEWR